MSGARVCSDKVGDTYRLSLQECVKVRSCEALEFEDPAQRQIALLAGELGPEAWYGQKDEDTIRITFFFS